MQWRGNGLVARAAVRVDRQGEGRPRNRRPELDERLVRHGPWRREAHPATDRLHEAGRRAVDLRLGPDVGQLDRGEAKRGWPDFHGRRADVALAQMPDVQDPAVLDLDERTQLVRLAEAVARSELLEIDEAIGWRLVVVGDAGLERDLRWPGDCLRRDP